MKYWGVKVDEVISYKDLMIHAESVDVYEGMLIFKVSGHEVFCIQPHHWICFYVAGKSGTPICVDHWDPVERNGDEY